VKAMSDPNHEQHERPERCEEDVEGSAVPHPCWQDEHPSTLQMKRGVPSCSMNDTLSPTTFHTRMNQMEESIERLTSVYENLATKQNSSSRHHSHPLSIPNSTHPVSHLVSSRAYRWLVPTPRELCMAVVLAVVLAQRSGLITTSSGTSWWPSSLAVQDPAAWGSASFEQDVDQDGVLDKDDYCIEQDGTRGWRSGRATDHDQDGCEDTSQDLDRDNDGVPDSDDRCAAGKVGWRSNPVTDFDGDGCQNTIEDSDNDGDGVANTMDLCPQSQLHRKVDENGCNVKQRRQRRSRLEHGQTEKNQRPALFGLSMPSAAWCRSVLAESLVSLLVATLVSKGQRLLRRQLGGPAKDAPPRDATVSSDNATPPVPAFSGEISKAQLTQGQGRRQAQKQEQEDAHVEVQGPSKAGQSKERLGDTIM